MINICYSIVQGVISYISGRSFSHGENSAHFIKTGAAFQFSGVSGRGPVFCDKGKRHAGFQDGDISGSLPVHEFYNGV